MEMCESILLASEIQQAPAEPYISGPEEPDLVMDGAHATHFPIK